MPPSVRFSRQDLLRISRRALAWALTAIYIVAGILHGAYHLDVSPQVQTIVVIGDTGTDGPDKGHVPDKGDVAGHHCHGCFSVSITDQVITQPRVDASGRAAALREIPRHGERRGIDPPPPKFPTLT